MVCRTAAVTVVFTVFLAMNADHAYAQQSSMFNIKLINGQTERDGIVMVQHTGIWGPVCGENFGEKEANLVCQHLGYQSGDFLCCNPYGTVEWHHNAMKKLTCHGNSTAIHHCILQHGSNNTGSGQNNHTDDFQSFQCQSFHYAAVVCRNGSASPERGVTLSIRGASGFTGSLVLTYDGLQGGVCADGWNQAAAERACQALHFQYGLNYTHYRHPYSQQPLGPLWTANVTCSSNSSTVTGFMDCAHVPLGKLQFCVSSHMAGVLCYNDSQSRSATGQGYPFYRLEDNVETNSSQGLVQVYINGEWGSIAGNIGWTLKDVAVLCKSLGFSSGQFIAGDAHRRLTSASLTASVWQVQPGCNGHEPDIMHCHVQGEWTKLPHQNHSQDLAVICFTNVELRDGSSARDGVVYFKAGLLQKTGGQDSDNSTWLPVCYESFKIADARVVCRELGFPDGLTLCCGQPFGSMDSVIPESRRSGVIVWESSCQGNESSLRDCPQKARIVAWHGCPTQNTYAAVTCFDTVAPTGSDYLLSIGFNDLFYYYYDYFAEFGHEVYDDFAYDHLELHNQTWGALTVLYNGISGRICFDGWEDNDAEVACREMGFEHGQSYNHYSDWHEDYNTDLMWSSNFNCTGRERALSECLHDGWGEVTHCQSNHHAGVLCYNQDEGVKYQMNSLANDPNTGRVEVLYPGSDRWGTLCASWWSDSEAKVFCRMFGYADGKKWNPKGKMAVATGPVYERTENCNGSELHIDHCAHDGYLPAYNDDCTGHINDAGIQCTPHAHTQTTARSSTGTIRPQTTGNSTRPSETRTASPSTSTHRPNSTEAQITTKSEMARISSTSLAVSTITSSSTHLANSTVTLRSATHLAESTVTSRSATHLTESTITSRSATHLTNSTVTSKSANNETVSGQRAAVSTTDDASADLNLGAIIGGIVGAVAACGLVAMGVLLWLRYKRQNVPKSPENGIHNIAYDANIDQIQLAA